MLTRVAGAVGCLILVVIVANVVVQQIGPLLPTLLVAAVVLLGLTALLRRLF